jgi:acyl dehydratase
VTQVDSPPPSSLVPQLTRGLTWEELPVGHTFRTAARTVTEADLVTFITWGGFNEPLFTDAAHAGTAGYTGRLVPGGLTYCFAEGLVLQSHVLEGTGLAFLHMELDILRPVYVGDTLHAVVQTVAARASSTPGRGVVTSRVTVRNQRDQDVLVYTPVRLIRGADYREPERGS